MTGTEIFHDEKIDPVVLADVVENTDMWMLQCSNSLGLSKKTLAETGIVAQMRGQDFDCDCAIEAGVFRAIHLTHTAHAYLGGNFVRAESRARKHSRRAFYPIRSE